MKRLLLSLAILLSVSFTMTVDAQNRKRDGKPGERIEKELNLTADQKQKMETMRADFGTKMKALRDNSSLDKDAKQSKMKELRDQHMAEVNKVLTPEQQAKMKELRSKRPEMAKNRDGKRGKDMNRSKKNEPRKGEMAKRHNPAKDLNLTDAQKDQIKSLREEYKAKSKDLAQQHRESMDKVYTPEQRAKIDDMRKNFNKEHKFSSHGKRGHRGDIKLDEASKLKLKDLKENYLKERKAVEMSRIAPDAQKQKLKDLSTKYREDKRQIIKEARTATKEIKTV